MKPIASALGVCHLIKPGAAVRYLIEGLWLEAKILMVSSSELLQELYGVLVRPYIQELIRLQEGKTLVDILLEKAGMLLSMGEIPHYTRDPKDDKFVACANAGQARYLTTLDKDILVLGKLRNLEMITPDFVERWRAMRE